MLSRDEIGLEMKVNRVTHVQIDHVILYGLAEQNPAALAPVDTGLYNNRVVFRVFPPSDRSFEF